MSRITCAISGIRFTTSYLESIVIPHTQGYFHPIFAVEYKQLHYLYTRYTKGELSPHDSYLLFLAFLHSSTKIIWNSPASLDPASSYTRRLVASNIAQLIRVLEQTATVQHPSFQQPSFKVSLSNNNLEQIPSYIKAWEDNIDFFYNKLASAKQIQDLQEVSNSLERLILSAEPPYKYAAIIADWASLTAEFPPELREYWKRIIRSSYSTTKMFNTPLADLKALTEYCEANIEPGSIHSHTLFKTLREGISRNTNYLENTSSLGYTLISPEQAELEAANTAALEAIIQEAPQEAPCRSNYTSGLDFIKAKLAYRLAVTSTSATSSTSSNLLPNPGEL